MSLNVCNNAVKIRKNVTKQTPNKYHLQPETKIEEFARKQMAEKFEKEIQNIINKPEQQRTLEEKIKLASYKAAIGLMDIKNYPPVMY